MIGIRSFFTRPFIFFALAGGSFLPLAANATQVLANTVNNHAAVGVLRTPTVSPALDPKMTPASAGPTRTATIVATPFRAPVSPTFTPTVTAPGRTQTFTLTVTTIPTFQTRVTLSAQRCLPADQLKPLLSTLVAEKTFSLKRNGRLEIFEHWRLVYRAPTDCLLEVFDPKGQLERKKYICGSVTTILAGKVHQRFASSPAAAWAKVIQFLAMGGQSDPITAYREIAPGGWIPDSTESKPYGKRPLKVSALTSFVTGGDVNHEFSAGDH